MREKLIELLGNVYLPMTCGPDVIGEYRIPHKFKKEIADYLIANGVVIAKMETTTDKDTNVPSKWIPVTERLPGKNMKCLCSYVFNENTEFHFEQVLYYIATCENPHFQHEGELGLKVTHWMPLPEPPKGE